MLAMPARDRNSTGLSTEFDIRDLRNTVAKSHGIYFRPPTGGVDTSGFGPLMSSITPWDPNDSLERIAGKLEAARSQGDFKTGTAIADRSRRRRFVVNAVNYSALTRPCCSTARVSRNEPMKS